MPPQSTFFRSSHSRRDDGQFNVPEHIRSSASLRGQTPAGSDALRGRGVIGQITRRRGQADRSNVETIQVEAARDFDQGNVVLPETETMILQSLDSSVDLPDPPEIPL